MNGHPLPIWHVLSWSICHVEDANNHTLDGDHNFFFCNSNTEDDLFPDGLLPVFRAYCRSAELILNWASWSVPFAFAFLCRVIFEWTLSAFRARTFWHPRTTIFAFFISSFRRGCCLSVSWSFFLEKFLLQNATDLRWQPEKDPQSPQLINLSLSLTSSCWTGCPLPCTCSSEECQGWRHLWRWSSEECHVALRLWRRCDTEHTGAGSSPLAEATLDTQKEISSAPVLRLEQPLPASHFLTFAATVVTVFHSCNS